MAGGGVEYIPLFDQLCIIFLQVSCWMINYTAQFTEIHYLKICVKNSEIRKHFWNQIVWPLCLTSYALFFTGIMQNNHLAHCTIGRGGVKTKWRQDACYWLWKLCVKILAAMKKDPSQFRKCPEQCFLRPDLNFFLEFQKKILFTIFVTLKMTIKKYFFQKKTCQKNLPTKFVEKICQLKMASDYEI